MNFTSYLRLNKTLLYSILSPLAACFGGFKVEGDRFISQSWLLPAIAIAHTNKTTC